MDRVCDYTKGGENMPLELHLEIEKIKKALLVGDFGEADVLFKYSLLTSKEYEAIKRELT